MNVAAFSLLPLLLTASASGRVPAGSPPVVLIADEQPDPRLPRPRVSPGDISDDSPKAKPKMLDNVSLVFKPTEDVSPYIARAAMSLSGKRVSIGIFGDQRPASEREVIGQNSRSGYLVKTPDDVGGWCSLELVKMLRRAGVEVVPSGGDLTISGKVTRFFVDEGDDYVGTVILQLSVADGSGTEIWKGQAFGTSSRWGRTYKEENYLESLSNTLMRAFDSWWSAPKFVTAMGK